MSKQNLKNAGLSQGRRKDGTFLPGTHWRKRKPFWSRPWLEKEYVEKKRSASDIAKDFSVGETAIAYWLQKHGIKCRTISEARSIKKWSSPGEANGMFGRCGSKNPRWIDGSSPERQTMYARSFWKELIKAVYERDGYKCGRCGAKHGAKNRLHAHHIKPWAGNPDSRFSLSNITTLCQTCHNWVHSKENLNYEFLSRR